MTAWFGHYFGISHSKAGVFFRYLLDIDDAWCVHFFVSEECLPMPVKP